MKSERFQHLAVMLWMIGLVWLGIRAIGHTHFRYAHPELTETQLQIIFLSSLCWWDVVPLSLFVIGMVLIFRASR